MTSQTGRPRWLGLSVLVVIVATLLVGVATLTQLTPGRSEGPLVSTSVTTVTVPISPGDVKTWGADLPPNPTDSDIMVRSVEPIDPVGVDIVGISMIRPELAGGVVTAPGYPPAGVNPFPVEGAVMTPAGGASPYLEVLTGIQLKSGSTEGSIAGLRVRYAASGREYEHVLPQSLAVVPPAP